MMCSDCGMPIPQTGNRKVCRQCRAARDAADNARQPPCQERREWQPSGEHLREQRACVRALALEERGETDSPEYRACVALLERKQEEVRRGRRRAGSGA